jgi:glycine C-acetyltransferase
MTLQFRKHLQSELDAIVTQGLLKAERVISSPQRAAIRVANGQEVLNFCANNYLGLADAAELQAAAREGLERYGFGVASVRFICGTQDVHKQLEQKLSDFLKTEDTILFSSCWDANGGVFEIVLSESDAVISDSLNHASIIDGIRLSKAKRFRYQSSDLNDLESKLKEAADCRFKLVVTDGVFSMDGVIADLKSVSALCEKYQAILMVDDSHAVGFIGENGRGTHELCDVLGKVDILTGTLGKALGGASGGYVSGRKEVVALLRQRARPYLFSNSLMPAIAHTSLTVLDLLQKSSARRRQLHDNAKLFRERMTALGFTLSGAGHPIIPVMLGDAKLAATFAEEMLRLGIYVVGFSFPVVPHGKARIRTQMSAAHSTEQVLQCVSAFQTVGKKLGVI